MAGIVLVSHGDLAAELLKTVEMIMGQKGRVEAVGLHSGEGLEFFQKRVREAVMKANDGEGVLIFADLFGGTPFNSCARLIATKEIAIPLDIVTGMNLPMIIEACTYKKAKNLKDLVEAIKSIAVSGIKFYSDLMGRENF